MEVTFVEVFMDASVEVTFVEAFMEASVGVASVEASVEMNSLKASTKDFRGSFHLFHARASTKNADSAGDPVYGWAWA